MPLYEYACPSGHRTEDWVHLAADKRPSLKCALCGQQARPVPSSPVIKQPPEVDPKTGLKVFKGNAWEGTPLEHDDVLVKGINPTTYKAEKIFIDGGKTP